MNDELEQEFRMVATEVLLTNDAAEGAQYIRQHANQVAKRMNQVNEKRRATERAQHAEDLLDDPEILKRVQAREAQLLRAFPGMLDVDRWHRAANDVRRTYGDANSRVIRGIRQQRFGARYSGDPENYQFDTGGDEVPEGDELEADEQQIIADRVQAISQLRVANMGRLNEVDKAKYNKQELRRRQRNGR